MHQYIDFNAHMRYSKKFIKYAALALNRWRLLYLREEKLVNAFTKREIPLRGYYTTYYSNIWLLIYYKNHLAIYYFPYELNLTIYP